MKSPSLLFIIITGMFHLTACDDTHDNEDISQVSGVGQVDQAPQPSEEPLIPYDPNTVPTDYIPESCSLPDMQRFVHRVMRDTYLWYDSVPDADQLLFDDFESLEQLLKFLQNKDNDRFSLIIDEKEYQNAIMGQRTGLGLSVQFDAAGALRVRYVDAESPAFQANIQRGDTITEINGKTIEELNYGQSWDTILGQDKEGVSVNLTLLKHLVADEADEADAGDTADSGTEAPQPEEPVIVSLKKAHYSPPPFPVNEIIEVGEKKVGYLLMNSLMPNAEAQMNSVFARYKNEGVSELILDLRYNPGGSLLTANQLASYIWGYGRVDSGHFLQGFHNNKYASLNWGLSFSQPSDRLYLTRVFILTGPDSCSASEALINGLKPHLEVVQVGAATCGKPYGMYGHAFCNKVFLPLEFEIKNALGQGGYIDGLSPICPMADDFEHALGDRRETQLDGALHYIANGQCGNSAGRSASSAVLPHSKPAELYHGIHRLFKSF